MFEWRDKATSFLTNIVDQEVREALRISKHGQHHLHREYAKMSIKRDEKPKKNKMLTKIHKKFKKIFKK